MTRPQQEMGASPVVEVKLTPTAQVLLCIDDRRQGGVAGLEPYAGDVYRATREALEELHGRAINYLDRDAYDGHPGYAVRSARAALVRIEAALAEVRHAS